jgi:hypothetical protein
MYDDACEQWIDKQGKIDSASTGGDKKAKKAETG